MIEHLLIEYSHIPERRVVLQGKVHDALQLKREAEELIFSANRTGQTRYYADHIGDTVSKIIDEYDEYMKYYYGQIKLYNKKERRICEALEKLAYPKREIIMMRYIKHMAWEEISEVISYSIRQCIRLKDAAIRELQVLCPD